MCVSARVCVFLLFCQELGQSAFVKQLSAVRGEVDADEPSPSDDDDDDDDIARAPKHRGSLIVAVTVLW